MIVNQIPYMLAAVKFVNLIDIRMKNSKIYPWVVVGFAMLSIVVLLAPGLQLYFLRPKIDNME